VPERICRGARGAVRGARNSSTPLWLPSNSYWGPAPAKPAALLQATGVLFGERYLRVDRTGATFGLMPRGALSMKLPERSMARASNSGTLEGLYA